MWPAAARFPPFRVESECRLKYPQRKGGNGARVFALFVEAFKQLPVASVVGGQVVVLHGGLFYRDGVTLETLDQMQARRPPRALSRSRSSPTVARFASLSRCVLFLCFVFSFCLSLSFSLSLSLSFRFCALCFPFFPARLQWATSSHPFRMAP